MSDMVLLLVSSLFTKKEKSILQPLLVWHIYTTLLPVSLQEVHWPIAVNDLGHQLAVSISINHSFLSTPLSIYLLGFLVQRISHSEFPVCCFLSFGSIRAQNKMTFRAFGVATVQMYEKGILGIPGHWDYSVWIKWGYRLWVKLSCRSDCDLTQQTSGRNDSS